MLIKFECGEASRGLAQALPLCRCRLVVATVLITLLPRRSRPKSDCSKTPLNANHPEALHQKKSDFICDADEVGSQAFWGERLCGLDRWGRKVDAV
jgi:hypothetical protein